MANQDTELTSKDTVELINNKVIPAINLIDKKVDVLANDVSHLTTNTERRLDDVDEKMTIFRKTLYGNGIPGEDGLVTSVAKMQEWVEARSAIEKAAIIGMIVAIIGEIAGFIFVALRLSALS